MNLANSRYMKGWEKEQGLVKIQVLMRLRVVLTTRLLPVASGRLAGITSWLNY
jgi:hypothetical protein